MRVTKVADDYAPKWINELKRRMKHSEPVADRLLNSRPYCWADKAATVQLMNRLLAGIPTDIWPPFNSNHGRVESVMPVEIVSGDWELTLDWDEAGQRRADLRNANNDHTAWVVEGESGFEDFDIGGS